MGIKKRFVLVFSVLFVLYCFNVFSLNCSEDSEWTNVEEYRCENAIRQIKQTRDPECYNESVQWELFQCPDNQHCEGEGVCVNDIYCGDSLVNENETCDSDTVFCSTEE